MAHHHTVRKHSRRRHPRQGAVLLLAGTLVLAAACGGSQDSAGGGTRKVTIGLVTKTETNPFFVTMRKAAADAAKKDGAELIALSGKFDGDNEGQVAAVESLVARDVQGILITPSNTTGVLGAIAEARRQGILVIALDSATDPEDAVDATYATDNFKAGRLQGAYVRAVLAGQAPELLMLDGTEGSSVSRQRHDGFLAGFGIKNDSPAIRGRANANGDRNLAQTATENLLQRTTEVNSVYTINEPVADGASTAIAERGLTGQVTIGTIDGGCDGVRAVQAGRYAATVMQFPVRMADRGVAAVMEFARSGKKPSGFTDTGTDLITDKPVRALASHDTDWGLRHCWG
ncbi:substrate-binding domain-containing protein [Streptomyces sp. ID05-04B]|uniref:substrate-binding domain-containing protein n=1 Tax=unclassified Streptomyces TaxID=2593676 RepID=UPI001572B0C6|nr:MULTISPECIES: substrate-binding domain-containing protein [unclassified Streptomyces]MDX5564294.1 substrate-binding domain-containing protein [Streptomyces sp. ID05-04B]